VLVHVRDVALVGELADLLDRVRVIGLASRAQLVDQRGIRPEMILDQALASRDHDGDVGYARRDQLPDGVLDDRLVTDRQHLLGDGLGQRQQPGTDPGRGDDRLGNRRSHELQYARHHRLNRAWLDGIRD
jgi:hypothetical protein